MAAPVRRTARVLLLDPLDRLLLFRFDDPQLLTEGRTSTVFWATAGGGVEPGESYQEGARREVREETGLTDVDLGPVVWTREKTVIFQQGPTHFVEQYFIARTAVTEISVDGQEEYEKQFLRGHRWWSPDDLRRTDELIFPEGIADLLAPILAGTLPTEPLRIV
jgi:8-oxo-dGTP pyrophosphatase MutT (NUDIX family)